ncbi:MAG: helix-turn-helix domain-containing protein [Lachnospiraceae bacterium]
MILADKITEERKKCGWSQEELADKLGVSRQAVSKWESAGSVPDLQRIIQMADLFGVSTDYLLRDEIDQEDVYACSQMEDDRDPIRRVSMEEANSFLNMKKKGAPIIANATSMCILSPVLLIMLGTMAEDHVFHITEALAAGAGCVFLFGMIAVAVFLFITCGMKESHMEYLQKEIFETEYGVSGMVRERSRSYEPTFTRGIAIGVVLCILAAVPLIIVGVMEAPDYVCGAFVGLLLLFIAIGVNIMIRVGIVKGSYDTLLQEGEYSKKEKRVKGKLDALSGVYWCLVTALYLGWSFWTMRWDYTWIVWPVAGVLFAAISGIMRVAVGAEE